MAARDIMPWNSPLGGHVRVFHFPMNASETFFEGEPVAVNADGEVTESATAPVPGDFFGIALGGPGASNTNPKTGVAWATGDLVPVCLPDANSTYISDRFAKASAAFDDTAPVASDIGDAVGLVLIGGRWGFDGAPDADDGLGRIVDILNSRKESILETGETLATTDVYYVVVQFIAHQSTADSAEAADPVA
jgi:hypothetical protein